MINAQKDYLKSFFQGSIRFVVPFYQRPYVWDEENWDVLWDNLRQVATDISNQKDAEHFIGTLITKQRVAQSIDDNSYDLIDGQQRLTSIALLLRAIADTATGDLPNLKSHTAALVAFEDAKGRKFQRIEHSRIDSPYFQKVIDGAADVKEDVGDNLIMQAYSYFIQKVAPLADDARDLLVNVILSRVPVISMLLSDKDDEQVIFDTINSLGVKLTTAELLKNFLFKEESSRIQYESLWQSVYESDDEQVSFWGASKTAGRVIRTNMEVLLYCYLIMSTKREIRIDRLFREYKEWLKEKNAVERLNVLASLKDLAEVYASLPTAEDYGELRFSDHEKRFFYVVDTLNITTAYPLILFLYQNFEDQERMLQLRTLESYLVRRNVCRFTTKNYNNLFLSLLQKLDEEKETGKLTTQSMMKILLELKEATNLFPSDEEFRKAFSASLLSNQNARTILVCLALYQQDSELHDQPMLAPGSMSVEHIMPRKWESHWSEGKMNALARQERERKILTLGNLTLVRKRLNSKLQNDSWVVKRETLRKYSSLGMTTSYLSLPKWGEEAIEARAEDLSRVALEIWSR